MAQTDGEFWSQAWLDAFLPYTTPAALKRAAAASRRNTFSAWKTAGEGLLGKHSTKSLLTHVSLRYSRYQQGKSYEAFLDELASRPDLVGPILNGMLPQGVADLCRRHKVEFIPKAASSFVVSCACREGSKKRFCSHMNMLVQWMADQIRSNPVLLFELRGIDLIAGLAERGIRHVPVKRPTPTDVAAGVARAMTTLTDETRDGRGEEELLRSIPYVLLGTASVRPEAYLPAVVNFSNQKDFSAWVSKARARAAKWWSAAQDRAHTVEESSRVALCAWDDLEDDLEAETHVSWDGTGEPPEVIVRTRALMDAMRAVREAEREIVSGMPPTWPIRRPLPGPRPQQWYASHQAMPNDVRDIFRGKLLPVVGSNLDDPDDDPTEEAQTYPDAVRVEESTAQRMARRLDRWAPGLQSLHLQPVLDSEGGSVTVRVTSVDVVPDEEEPVGVRDFDRIHRNVPFPHYVAALLNVTDRAAQELSPVDEAWRTVAVTAAHLTAKGWTIPTAAGVAADEQEGLPKGHTRILWIPTMGDPAVAAVASQLAEGLGPVALKMLGLTPESPMVREAEALGIPFQRLAAAWALIHAAGAVMRAANTADLVPKSSLGELLVLQEDMSVLDGTLGSKSADAVFSAFQPMAPASFMPFAPVVVLTMTEKKSRRKSAAAESDFGLTFGMMPEGVEAEGVADSKDAEPVTLDRIVADPALGHRTLEVMQALEVVSRIAPELAPLGAHPEKPVKLTPDAVGLFLVKTIPVLRVFGIGVALPAALKRLVRPRLVAEIGVKSKATNTKAWLTKEALTEFSWQVALGDETVSEAEFRKLAEMKGSIVPVGNSYVYLDAEMVDELLAQLKRSKKPDAFERFRAVLMGGIDGAEVRVSDQIRSMTEALLATPERTVPDTIHATLRPYQQRGYAWLMKNVDLGLGSLIADDMGLGKTLQVICAIAQMKAEGRLADKALVVAPTTLLTNWTREIAKFAPTLKVRVHHGQSRRAGDWGGDADVVLTSYGTLRSDANELADRKFSLLVVDEAQAVKNHATAQAKAVRAVKADHVIAMTGTPVENRLMEYWSILDLVQPKLLGAAADFQRRIATPIEVDHDPERLAQFRRLTAPFMIRRTKDDKKVIADLPEKSSIDVFTELTDRQAALYKSALDTTFADIHRLKDEAVAAKIEEGLPMNAMSLEMQRRGRILKLIGQLKAICNSPAQFMEEDAAAPDSGKAESLMGLLAQLHDAGRKVIIFTQFRRMGELLQNWIQRSTGQRPDFLHGGVSRAARQQMVDRFQEDRSVRAIIVSLKAGGTGLNLTAASAVIHYDLWWNPAVETQATDRAYRIGQRRDVLVYRFVTAGTFEERINKMLVEKRELADLTVSTGETWIGDLPETDLREFLALADDAYGTDGASAQKKEAR